MSKWRPFHGIRVKALGLHWRSGRLLAAEIYNDAGEIKGVRPLGGAIEFGETAQEAVIREFQEELGIDIATIGDPFFFENIYVHEGAPGHELLVLFEVSLPDDAFLGEERIVFNEDNGETGVARWFDLDELDLAGGPELYPAGLKALLAARGS